MSGLLWLVAQTRPRCEKRFLQFCEREDLSAALPCYRAAHKYQGKTVAFRKPLLPGQVFLQLAVEKRRKIHQSDYLANLLDVADQELFIRQLENVLRALETDLEIRLVPKIGKGTLVEIKNGHWRGIEVWVEQRFGMNTVLLRPDFIGHGASVKLNATDIVVTPERDRTIVENFTMWAKGTDCCLLLMMNDLQDCRIWKRRNKLEIITV
jgi:hypothetical protein